jgi:hypothetical protein
VISLDDMFTLNALREFVDPNGSSIMASSSMVDNLNTFRSGAHHAIAGFLGYEFLRDSYVLEPYDGNGMQQLYLDNRPVTGLQSAIFAPWGGQQKTDYTSKVSIYRAKTGPGYLFMQNDFFHMGLKAWQFSYQAGWPVTSDGFGGSAIVEPVPGCIVIAGLKLCSLYLSLWGQNTAVGKASITEPAGGMISFDLEAQKHILEEVYEYKLVGF